MRERDIINKSFPPSVGEGDITNKCFLQVRDREALQTNVPLINKCLGKPPPPPNPDLGRGTLHLNLT